MFRTPPGGIRQDAVPPTRKGWLPQTFASFRYRNYRLFFIGQLISLTGSWMEQMAMSWLAYQLTNSALFLGVASTVGTLPILLFAIPGGVLADRVNKRRLLIYTQIALMACSLMLAALIFTHLIRPWQILLLAFCAGTALSFDMPTRQAFVPELVGREELMNAIALNSSIFNGARIVGPAVAGIVVASLGLAWCFLINAVSFLAVIAGLLLMQVPPKVARIGQQTNLFEDALGGLRYLWQHQRVRAIAALMAVFSIFGWTYSVLMPVFARDILHAGARGLSLLMTSNGIGAFIGALIVASIGNYPRRGRLLLGGALLLGLAGLGFAYSHSFIVSALLLALAGFGGVALMSSANTMIQLAVTDEMRGRIMGVWSLVFIGSTPVGSLLAGLLAKYWNAPAAVMVGAGVTILTALLAGVIIIRRRNPAEAADN